MFTACRHHGFDTAGRGVFAPSGISAAAGAKVILGELLRGIARGRGRPSPPCSDPVAQHPHHGPPQLRAVSGSSTSPVSPSTMISDADPRPPMQPRAARIASMKTRPKPSPRLGMTTAVHRSYSCARRSSLTRPRKTIWSPRFSAAAFCSSRGRSSPSPTIRRTAPGTSAATSRQTSISRSCPLYRSSAAMRPTISADGTGLGSAPGRGDGVETEVTDVDAAFVKWGLAARNRSRENAETATSRSLRSSAARCIHVSGFHASTPCRIVNSEAPRAAKASAAGARCR